MSEKVDFDLSGQWTGIYNYPAFHPPNSFEAILREVGGALSGTVSEQDEEPHGGGRILHSFIEGHRQGSAVSFTKMYDDLERMPDAIFYSGILQPDGNEISGHWEIPGAWAGTFLMIRNPGVAEAAEEEAGEEVVVEEASFLPRPSRDGEDFRSSAPSAATEAHRSLLAPRP